MAIKYRKGQCVYCLDAGDIREKIIVKRLPKGSFCNHHNQERLMGMGTKRVIVDGLEMQEEANRIAQDNITEEDPGEKKFEKQLKMGKIGKSKKQTDIDRRYRLMLMDFDYTEAPVCSGCGRYSGIVSLSHSHVISRKHCKDYGIPELIYDRNNLRYHCMGNSDSCHQKWEHPQLRKLLWDYERNLEYIKSLGIEELYHKYRGSN